MHNLSPQELLKQYGISPNKVLGQNFLVDEEVLDRVVKVAEIQAGEFVVEIGPGIGNLTEKLLKAGARVFAIEKDKSFAPILNHLAKKFKGQLKIQWGDALKIMDYESQIADWSQVEIHSSLKTVEGSSKYKIIGNIPYYLTGKLLPMLLSLQPLPESVTLFVQKEVVERMTAKVGQMSLLALAVQMKSKAKLVFSVPARSFYPAPKVDSAVVQLTDIGFQLKNISSSQAVEVEKRIFRLAKAGFLGKRKTLLNSLSGNLGLSKEEVETALNKCKIDPKTRPQELAIEDWQKLVGVISFS